jgi:hypothetical protein
MGMPALYQLFRWPGAAIEPLSIEGFPFQQFLLAAVFYKK